MLVDGTPATCAQLGLNHLFSSRSPIDLVLSGPNFGRNSTVIYALSSGTIGGAMEASICGARAIALSWAYDSREHDPKALEATARQSCKVVEHLYAHWGADVDLYSVNVPVRPNAETSRVMITTCLHNRWNGVSSFKEVDAPENLDEDEAALADKASREEEQTQSTRIDSSNGEATSGDRHARFQHHYYHWAPSHNIIKKGVTESHEGNDGLAINDGYTSVTPLKAAFMEAKAHPVGELKM